MSEDSAYCQIPQADIPPSNMSASETNTASKGLVHAAAHDDWESAWRRLDRGEDANSKWDGYTMLQIAAINGSFYAAIELLSHGATVHDRAAGGATAAHLAAAKGHTKMLKLLIDCHADKNVRGDDGATPLTLSARWGYLDTVKMLMKKGADMTLRDRLGMTASDWAIKEGHHDIVHFLSTVQADIAV